MFIFAGFIIGLGGFEVYKSQNSNNNPNPQGRFLQKPLAKIKQFEIIAGRQITQLIFEDSNWFLELNSKVLADTKLINSILQDMQDSTTEKIPTTADPQTLASYGLDDPLASVKFTKELDQTMTLSLSPDKAYNGDFYLKYEDQSAGDVQILVSNYNWLDLLLRNPSSFLRKDGVINYAAKDLQKVQVDYLFLKQHGQKALNVLSEIDYTKIDDVWSIRPSKGNDPATINTILQSLKDLKIQSYEEDPFVLKKPKEPGKYLQMHFKFIAGQSDELVFYDKYKDCEVEGQKSECQLLTLSSLAFPFWVEKSKLKFLVEQDYLK